MKSLASMFVLTLLICCSVNGQQESTELATGLEKQLKDHVSKLATEIGERNLGHIDALNKSADWVEGQFESFGYPVSRQTFKVRNLDCHNIIAEKTGSKQPKKIVIVGAHYDSVIGTPGANDNGSGTASLIVLAEQLKDFKSDFTLRFVAFTNEEPPYFQQEGEMGSWVYARRCRKNGDDIVGVISLETMGYFSDEKDSQKYPPLIRSRYPSTGNFIGFVSNVRSKAFTRRCFKVFKEHCDVPAEVASLPGTIPGVGWSDHWSFWQEDYVGLMVTDTAPFRYPHYHKASDTPDKIVYETLAQVVVGLKSVIKEISVAAKPQEGGKKLQKKSS